MRPLITQSIENSYKILLLMLLKMSLNCTEIACINDINDQISFEPIPMS